MVQFSASRTIVIFGFDSDWDLGEPLARNSIELAASPSLFWRQEISSSLILSFHPKPAQSIQTTSRPVLGGKMIQMLHQKSCCMEFHSTDNNAISVGHYGPGRQLLKYIVDSLRKGWGRRGRWGGGLLLVCFVKENGSGWLLNPNSRSWVRHKIARSAQVTLYYNKF